MKYEINLLFAIKLTGLDINTYKHNLSSGVLITKDNLPLKQMFKAIGI